jgi:hypothetical protein
LNESIFLFGSIVSCRRIDFTLLRLPSGVIGAL